MQQRSTAPASPHHPANLTQLRRHPGDPHALAGRMHVHLVALTAGLDRDAEEWIGSEYGDLGWLTYEARGTDNG